MRLRLLLGIASRQLASRSHSGVVRLVSALSVAGIAIGVASMLLLQGFMNGFQRSISGFLTAANPPLLVSCPSDGILTPGDIAVITEAARGIDGVTTISAAVEKAAVASGRGGSVAGVIVRGVDWQSEFAVTGLHRLLGSVPDGAVVGRLLAARLSISEGDTIRLASTESATLSAAGRALVDTIIAVRVASVCDFGLEEYNSGLVAVHRATAEALFGCPGLYTYAGLGLEPGVDPVAAASRLGEVLREEYVESRTERFMLCEAFISRHANLFRAFGLERLGMTIVLGMITVVALLNLSSALSMIALEHRRDFGVLRAMGAPPGTLVGIALSQGAFLGLAGSGAGALFAAAIHSIVNTVLPIRLESSVYWIDTLPSRIDPVQSAAVIAGVVAACLLASVFPALRALSVPPAECVRHE